MLYRWASLAVKRDPSLPSRGVPAPMDVDAAFRWLRQWPKALPLSGLLLSLGINDGGGEAIGGVGKGGEDGRRRVEEAGEWLSTLLASPQMERAFWFSGVVCLSLVVSHLLMVLFIAFHDISGRWDKYSLKYQRSSWWTYAQHAPSFFFDVGLLLAPALLVFGYAYDTVLYEPLLPHGDWRQDGVRVAALLGAATINNVINRLWAMGVHWLMHESKLLYRAVHKRHHCQIRDFCALSAWQDSTLEFVLMEVFGVFLFAQLFNPLPWHFHVLFALINGLGAAIDHSAFYIPGTIIDGRYHWDHHLRIDYNFSELEFLDSMFGTLYTHHHPLLSSKAAVELQQSPRLRRRKQPHPLEEDQQPLRQWQEVKEEGNNDEVEEQQQLQQRRPQRAEEGQRDGEEERESCRGVATVSAPDPSLPEEEQFRPNTQLESRTSSSSSSSSSSSTSNNSNNGYDSANSKSSNSRERELPESDTQSHDRKTGAHPFSLAGSPKAKPWS